MPDVDTRQLLQPGTVFDDNLLVERFIDSGGMGQVYEVSHRHLGDERWAIKLPHLTYQQKPQAIKRFLEEAKCTYRLSHPNITKVVDVKQDAETKFHFLRMELVSGYPVKNGQVVHSLESLLKVQSMLDEEDILIFLQQTLDALSHAHEEHKLIHRDIKPANLLLDGKAIKITDFGLAEMMGKEERLEMASQASKSVQGSAHSAFAMPSEESDLSGSRVAALAGTWEYMSPEQKKGEKIDERSDLYSLGLVAYRMLTGTLERGYGSQLEDFRQDVLQGWEHWLPRISAIQITKRYKKADMAKAQLSEILEEERLRKAEEERKAEKERKRIAEEKRRAEEELAAKGLAEEQAAKAERFAREKEAALRRLEKQREEEKRQAAAQKATAKTTRRQREVGTKTQRIIVKKKKPFFLFVLVICVALTGFGGWKWWTYSPFKVIPVSVPLGEGTCAGEEKVIGGIAFSWCPSGTFLMGSPESEEGRYVYGETQHKITLTWGFWMAKTEVTQGQWKAVMGNNPSYFRGWDAPVETVSWEDAVAFCKKLTEQSQLPTGWTYRLPTKTEWEYACRAGTTTVFHFGNVLEDQTNFDGNFPYGTTSKGPFLNKTAKVGSYQPNAWGLYDMHGNVAEWCNDVYPGGNSSQRAFYGGTYSSEARFCRAACHHIRGQNGRDSFLGFRLSVSRIGLIQPYGVGAGQRIEHVF